MTRFSTCGWQYHHDTDQYILRCHFTIFVPAETFNLIKITGMRKVERTINEKLIYAHRTVKTTIEKLAKESK